MASVNAEGKPEEVLKFRIASQVAAKLSALVQLIEGGKEDWEFLEAINQQLARASSPEEVSLTLLARDLVLDCHSRVKSSRSETTCLRQITRYGNFVKFVEPINLSFFSKVPRRDASKFILCAGMLISSPDLKEALSRSWGVAKNAKMEFTYY